jgi:uncharacterized repeat protein (TIGR01451 family)
MTATHSTAVLETPRRRLGPIAALASLALVAGSLAVAPAVSAADPGPDVGIAKHAGPWHQPDITTTEAGDQFRYRIIVWNHGDLAAENVTVTDDLDDDLVIDSTFVEVNGQKPPDAHPCNVAAGNVLTCVLGHLEPQNDADGATEDSGYVRILVTAPRAACGDVTNQASVTADGELSARLTDNTSRLVSVNVHCPDIAAPTVNRPKTTFWRTTRLGTKYIPLRTSWTASDDDSGIGQFQVQRRIDDGAWKSVSLSRPRIHSVIIKLAPGHKHQFRVRAEDNAGNWSGWHRGTAFKLKARQETAAPLDFTQSWKLRDLSGAYGGQVKRSGGTGAHVGYAFTGRGIAWVSTMGPTLGSATVFVDGSEVATISLHRASKRTRMVVWRMNWTTSGSHTVKIVVDGTAGHPLVEVDAFAVQR